MPGPTLRHAALAAALLLAAAPLALAVSVDVARAAGAAPAPAAPPVLPDQSVRVVGPDGAPIAPPSPSEVERYCTSIADQARDARYAAQTRELKAMETAVAARLDELEAKRAEYQKWLEERRAFLDSADAILLDIYAKMKPDAAAGQLSGLDRETAGALIAKMKPRQASAILSEMKPKDAAEIAAVIAAKTADPEAEAAAAPAATPAATNAGSPA